MGRVYSCTVTSFLSSIAEGLTASQLAKRHKISKRCAWNYLKELRLGKLIFQVSKNPAIFELMPQALSVQQWPSGGYAFSATISSKDVEVVEVASRLNPRRVAEPHRFGAKFSLVGERVWGGKVWKANGGLTCRKWVEGDVTFVVFQGKFRQSVTVWLKAFRGLSVLEQIARGNDVLVQAGHEFGAKFGCRVEFVRKMGPREWTTTEVGVGLSKSLMDGLGIHRQGDFVDLGNVRVKANDFSHPGLVEFEDIVKDASRPLGSSDLFVRNLELVIQKTPELVSALELVKEHELMLRPKPGSERREIG